MIGNLLRIAAPDIRDIPPRSAFKPADETRTVSPGLVFADDTDLLLDLDADSSYRFLLTLYYTAASSDLLVAYLAAPYPAGTAGGWSIGRSQLGYGSGPLGGNTLELGAFTTTPEAETLALLYAQGGGSMRAVLVAGTIVTTAPGTLRIPWYGSSSTSTDTVAVNAGSELTAWKSG